MKKLFIILTVLCTLVLTGTAVLAKKSSASNVHYASFSEVQADINKYNARSSHKQNTRYSVKCPKCKVKSYYKPKSLRNGKKIYCNNCGYSFRPGIISNRGQRVKPLKKSNFGGAYYNKK